MTNAKNKTLNAIEKVRALRFTHTNISKNIKADPQRGWNIKQIKGRETNIKRGTLNCKGLNEAGKRAITEAWALR